METRILEIKKFDLFYDGVYKIKFDGERSQMIYLDPIMLLNLLQNEGYSSMEQAIAHSQKHYGWKMSFEKSTVQLIQCIEEGRISGYLTSEIADYLQVKNIYLLDFKIVKS